MSHPPLVLIHGLWDTPRLFRRLVEQLDGRRDPLLIPHLQHGLGQVPLETLTERLNSQIVDAFGPGETVDLLGFSMGGLLARAWIQQHGGYRRTRRFVCVGSPQRGTLAAQLVPRALLPSIADMKLGSRFIRQLADDHHRHPQRLASIDCRSFYCRLDLMVIPSWLGVLPVGPVQALPAPTHPALITATKPASILAESLLQP
ncbi:MAG: alpha/beta hydrolase [Cyanobacteria bacterium M_surface_7_m2_040]|nr:alpha/beta hydrolase [Cyanobacteria bacterium K_DeepCast_35m_m2_023]MBM5828617.1 alpha/beta hydrolase [Cyanobacteria bacterium M_surface_7_m2_040]